jgi:hypothetical protein
MHRIIVLMVLAALLLGCSGGGSDTQQATTETKPAITLNVTPPDPIPVPEAKTPTSDTDWATKVHNKDIEIIQVLNIINPVAAYLTEGFKQYENRFSPTLKEEWTDTQHQLTQALNLYDDCKKRRDAGKYDKQLFLDMEHVWQLLVKTGVAGVRTKSMMDDELQKIAGM